MLKAAPILGSAGSIMSIASGFSAMMDAITMTNSGKPMGRCPEDTQSSALTSDKKLTSDLRPLSIFNAALHKQRFGMAGRRCRSRQELMEVSALAAAARGGILRAAFVVRAAGVEPAQRLRAEGF